MKTYLEMLRYMRPEGSEAQSQFCERFLAPIFGKPDSAGNYAHIIGRSSRVLFTAHHDTVHRDSGMQSVTVVDGLAMLADGTRSNCLGADCTSGIWIILQMIAAGIPGVYVIHAGEEIGCVGSRAYVKANAAMLRGIDAVISFDRRGMDSIVTHQMELRTTSDQFADSLSEILDMPQMIADPRGAYTDSNEYAYVVPECTNISVGYSGQHGKGETQDLAFLALIAQRLIAADWRNLVIARDHTKAELDDWPVYDDGEESTMARLIEQNPDMVAAYLINCGFTVDDIREELCLERRH